MGPALVQMAHDEGGVYASPCYLLKKSRSQANGLCKEKRKAEKKLAASVKIVAGREGKGCKDVYVGL